MKLKMMIPLLLLLPNLSFAEFKSQDELINRMNDEGINRLVVNQAPDLRNMYVTTADHKVVNTLTFINQNGVTRLDSLDIKPHRIFKPNLSAYNVANSFICYLDNSKVQRVRNSTAYSFCLSAAENVEQIIDALEGRNKAVIEDVSDTTTSAQ